MEQHTLTTPITKPSMTGYVVASLVLDWRAKRIVITLVGSDGLDVFVQYTGTEAETQMRTLNTANLTANSLHKRIITKLVADGKVPAGTVTGSPDA